MSVFEFATSLVARLPSNALFYGDPLDDNPFFPCDRVLPTAALPAVSGPFGGIPRVSDCGHVQAQAPAAREAWPPRRRYSNSRGLVARMRLYPDDLIAIIPSCATSPLQLVRRIVIWKNARLIRSCR